MGVVIPVKKHNSNNATEEALAALKQEQEAIGEWVDIDRVRGWEKNPKRHPEIQILDLIKSIKRFGWGAPLLARPNGELIAGHGRLEAARRLGLTKVPVRYMNLDPTEAHLLALADNKLTEIGEWDDVLVREILEAAKLEGADLEGLGWSNDDLVALLDSANGDGAGPDGVDDMYTRKITVPIYEPKGPKPHISELVDTTKADQLIDAINRAALPKDVAAFLVHAAQRHTSFHFAKIAEFYAHSSAEVQELMEQSALVIIDFNKAIEHGFVQLSETLGKIADHEVESDDEE